MDNSTAPEIENDEEMLEIAEISNFVNNHFLGLTQF